MPRLALYTFGVLTSPLSDPAATTGEFHALPEGRSGPYLRGLNSRKARTGGPSGQMPK